MSSFSLGRLTSFDTPDDSQTAPIVQGEQSAAYHIPVRPILRPCLDIGPMLTLEARLLQACCDGLERHTPAINSRVPQNKRSTSLDAVLQLKKGCHLTSWGQRSSLSPPSTRPRRLSRWVTRIRAANRAKRVTCRFPAEPYTSVQSRGKARLSVRQPSARGSTPHRLPSIGPCVAETRRQATQCST